MHSASCAQTGAPVALQSFLIVGYTSIPLPGGTGIFEYLCYHMYEAVYADTAFVLSFHLFLQALF